LKIICTLFIAALTCSLAAQTPVHLNVNPHINVSPVSPTLYGLMTEEINYSYDGGLYAEMVRNRTFAHSWDGYEHWDLQQDGSGRARISEGVDGPSRALPKSLKLTITQAEANNEAGILNEGYWGMAVLPGTTYTGSFYTKPEGETTAHVRLVANATGVMLAEAMVPLQDGAGWKQYSYTMKTISFKTPPTPDNHLVITFDRTGSVNLQLVSLFSPTYKNRTNGNRIDLMKMMAAMHPNFLRLPGGNYLEGDTFKDRFDWNKTIGPLVDRPTHHGPWSYQSSDGMGLLEFLEWCEDLKIEPVLAVFDGYSLHGEHVAGEALKPYIQDALDEIEFVTGDSSTRWGAMRATYGHPKPFTMHYIEIGNEDQFDKSGSYDQRFAQFATAIRARYPQYKLIATTPVKGATPDAVDDHYYQTPQEFFSMVHKYDHRDRSGPKVFVGEWATRVGSPTPNLAAALGDAAWMTSMERNSDLIVMASYAPLFVNVNPGGMQWSTDLIGYNALKAYPSPSYWAQVMFAAHLGNHTVKSSLTGDDGLFFHSVTVSADGKILYLKMVNASDRARKVTLAIDGARNGRAPLQTLSAPSRWATNSLQDPGVVHPVDSSLVVQKGEFTHSMPANSIEVVDIPLVH
jgi:alpha-N-arabinofuranosidase